MISTETACLRSELRPISVFSSCRRQGASRVETRRALAVSAARARARDRASLAPCARRSPRSARPEERGLGLQRERDYRETIVTAILMIDEFVGHLQDDLEITREQRQSILAKGISRSNCERWAVIGGGSDKESSRPSIRSAHQRGRHQRGLAPYRRRGRPWDLCAYRGPCPADLAAVTCVRRRRNPAGHRK